MSTTNKIGRPPIPADQRKQLVSGRVSPAVRRYLRSTGDIGGTIDAMVRRTKAFRDVAEQRKQLRRISKKRRGK